jgi:hypothetical protein
MTPLHFGWFGGWPIKVAYFLLGLGLTSVTSSGVAIWLARRRDKGRPAPRWERVWIAFVWSQPVAYAASALVALFAPAPPVAVWGLATLHMGVVGVARRFDAQNLDDSARGLPTDRFRLPGSGEADLAAVVSFQEGGDIGRRHVHDRREFAPDTLVVVTLVGLGHETCDW